VVELRNVSFSYNGAPALSRVSLAIHPGESIALLGPNGSGKSTLLRILNALIHPETGEYLFDGRNITAASMKDEAASKALHRRIGFLFQNPDSQLFCPCVRAEVAFGPLQMGLGEAAVTERVGDCLRLLGLSALAERPPHQLSEGEKRKVALAAVLALNPDILTLDEPMNGLDPRTKGFLRELLIELNSAGKTLICATHDYRYVEGVFSRAVVFSEAHEIARDGPWEEVVGDAAFLAAHNLA
jgi:cobalt/nickel transport system ATP-binding protein